MFIAKDFEGVLVDIENSVKGVDYFCPGCNSLLVRKIGSKVCHHYAHKSIKDCDTFYEPMTSWHKGWQECFPIDTRETVLRSGDIFHRADVMLDNIVIEFQHSNLSMEKVKERTDFYLSNNKRMLWVWDYTYKQDEICLLTNNTEIDLYCFWYNQGKLIEKLVRYNISVAGFPEKFKREKMIIISYDLGDNIAIVNYSNMLIINKYRFIELVNSGEIWRLIKCNNIYELNNLSLKRGFMSTYIYSRSILNNTIDYRVYYTG